jgi:hypothetical protein
MIPDYATNAKHARSMTLCLDLADLLDAAHLLCPSPRLCTLDWRLRSALQRNTVAEVGPVVALGGLGGAAHIRGSSKGAAAIDLLAGNLIVPDATPCLWGSAGRACLVWVLGQK